MSITSDVKGYADAAVEQGKQVVDLAQARLAKSANEAAKLADLDAVKGTVGGYLAQANRPRARSPARRMSSSTT